ncbi:MAG: SsrA-binding protein SmpB [Candidatus Tokpelaia sp.]|nr:MAG: SsrA-binding protein SmpB [Candidatus Tokpelaia sp.]KAA6206915.1 MAG: SsrA-binding protein SmpB [Candidatus Tokpelaia sp.]KAA6405508.1 SsrA-binding protein [Candidatus Tokpelaia sp.]
MIVKKPTIKRKILAENRKARFNYEILDNMEAGLVLVGTEVKSLRANHANIAESYASFEQDGLWLINAHIPEYTAGNRFNHEPRRLRKLLLHSKEMDRLAKAVEREGMTIVPLRLYFNPRGRAKIEIALARGKKLHDKRQTEKKRDWGREKARLLRQNNK